jgi:hypothetical protein
MMNLFSNFVEKILSIFNYISLKVYFVIFYLNVIIFYIIDVSYILNKKDNSLKKIVFFFNKNILI